MHGARLPARHAAHVPHLAAAAGRHDAVTHLAFEHAGLVPDGRHAGNEAQALLLTLVLRGGVAQHRQRRVVDDILRQLAAARPLAHRLAVDRAEVLAHGVAHGPLRIVDRTGHHADEGHRHVVGHLVHLNGRPLHLLEAVHALEVDDVGIGALHARRLVDAVQVEQQPVAGGRTRRLVDEVGEQLVVAVHEVDLEAADAHLRVVGAELLHLPGKGEVANPENQPHAPLGAVGDQRRKVDVTRRLEGTVVAGAPAVVHHHIAQAVGGREVDVVFIGALVDARLEVDAVEAPAIPPLPGRLAGLNPRDVVQPAGGGQTPHQVGLGQLRVVAHQRHRPPGERLPRRNAGDVGFVLLDDALHAVVAARNDAPRAGGKDTLEPVGGRTSEEHAGIALQVGIGDADPLAARRADQQRQEGQPRGVHRGERSLGIGILERLHELLAEGEPFVLLRRVAHVGNHRR